MTNLLQCPGTNIFQSQVSSNHGVETKHKSFISFPDIQKQNYYMSLRDRQNKKKQHTQMNKYLACKMTYRCCQMTSWSWLMLVFLHYLFVHSVNEHPTVRQKDKCKVYHSTVTVKLHLSQSAFYSLNGPEMTDLILPPNGLPTCYLHVVPGPSISYHAETKRHSLTRPLNL